MPSWKKCLFPPLVSPGTSPTLMAITGGILCASLTRIPSNKIACHSLSLALSPLFSPFSVPSPFSRSPLCSLTHLFLSASPTISPGPLHRGDRLTVQLWL